MDTFIKQLSKMDESTSKINLAALFEKKYLNQKDAIMKKI
jgi:hypothetical protein